MLASTPQLALSAPCVLSLPVSAGISGLVAGQLDCSHSLNWGIRTGVALLGFEKPVPYVRATVGIAYPTESALREKVAPPQGWQLLQTLRYVYLPGNSFEKIQNLSSEQAYKSPAIQQWSVLLDSDVAFELRFLELENRTPEPFFGIKVWQTLPQRWRTLGALQDTNDADAHGIVGNYYFRRKQWSVELGIGRMTVEVDRVAATFFHPTFAVALKLGELPQ
jgi:hypothetical protein